MVNILKNKKQEASARDAIQKTKWKMEVKSCLLPNITI